MSGQTVLFDINETVLDLSVLKPKFQQYMGSDDYIATWFAMLLHSSTVCLITNTHTDFKSLGLSALESLAGRLGKRLSNQDYQDILSTFAHLPAHPDIEPALVLLREAGFRVVAFSNSSSDLLKAQLSNSGLLTHFDHIISTEQASTFKPAQVAYQFALELLQEPASSARLVAAHDWDTHGALYAGLKAAYVNRFNTTYNTHYLHPDIRGEDMLEVTRKIISARV
ncbi:haloacid dehalogenase type II [Vibrio astriarenae]|uniref:(S)-2-haloacid dehalogenase n=1 Tax=Vibrio astriarenae TaxID=1481923 RepID=A0A7Z2YFF0_9VIBR|nr:haloacid dehalogenase type II [Vibrio astriarenae]QIA65119.1 haloacid dehalogenase type II [Vibrio astriarenae]